MKQYKLINGKLVGVPDESLTPNLDNYQNEADYLSDLNKHMEYCRIYGEFENLRVGGVLPAPGKFHTELFPSEKKAGGHVYGTYEDYIEYYNKYASLPAYSLSKELKEWCEKNPKDSYPESDFVLIDECVNSLVCQMADKCQGCKTVAYPKDSKFVYQLSRISKND